MFSRHFNNTRNEKVMNMLRQEFGIVVKKVPIEEAVKSAQWIIKLPRKGELKLATKEYAEAIKAIKGK